MRGLNGITAFIVCSLALTVCARAPADPPREEQIHNAIRQLGDESFFVREKATVFLWNAGRPAEPALRQALRSGDREVVRRAQSVLDKFKWGLYPDTPKDIVDLVARYHGTDAHSRRSLVQQLLDKGAPGYLVVVRLAAAGETAGDRQALLQQLAQEGPRFFAQLIAEGKLTALKETLERSLETEQPSAYRNFAAYFSLRGELDEKIALYRSRLGGPEAKQSAEMLAYLYRTKGDLSSARAAALKADKADLAKSILWEQGDWKELLDHYPPPRGADGRSQAEALGFLLAYQRLAHDSRGTDATAAEICKLAADSLPASENSWICGKALLLNDRPKEAIKVLRKAQRDSTAFELLAAQMHFHEALELREPSNSESDFWELSIQQGRVLYLLGKSDEAHAVFARLGRAIESTARTSPFASLVEVESRLGLKDQALTHCASMLARSSGEAATAEALDALFPDKLDTAEPWWWCLRKKFAGETPAKSLTRVRDLLEAKLPENELAELTIEGEKAVAGATAERREKWRFAVADAARLIGANNLAATYLEKETDLPAASAAAHLRLADYLAENKHWEKAAVRYQTAWKKDQRQALPLYLSGSALVHAGREEQGRKAIAKARLLPLADDNARYSLAEALEKRGLAALAEEEYSLVVETGQFDSWYVSNAHRHLARAALSRKDYLAAAHHDERALLDCLRAGTGFLRPGAYLAVPQVVHRQKARGLLAAGRLEDARAEIERALTLLPGEVDVAIELVPELEKKGHGQDADKLFMRLFDVHEKVCSDYPKSAWEHNTVAWLTARCRRQLDRGLEHATKAVELAPADTGYRDSLAEVHFQRGDTAKAIDIMVSCSLGNPKNAYYRKQLERFRAGNRLADVPEQNE